MMPTYTQEINDASSSSESFEEEDQESAINAPTNQKVNVNLKELQSKIAFSNAQLLELTFNDQKFIKKIKQYNLQAVDLMKNQDYEKSLVYLQEAQKILQYAASCGKTIDRFLIVYTLHNEASAYQKIWELEKSADYMEAIIFNLNTYLNNCHPIPINQQLLNRQSQFYQHFSSSIYRRLLLAIYSLQYSAVNSQIGRHDVAIQSVKNALQLLSKNLTEEYAFESYQLKKTDKKSELKILRDSCEGINKSQIPEMLINIRKIVKIVKNKHLAPTSQVMRLRKFSIGEVMQIQPKQFQEIIRIVDIDNMINSEGKIHTALYISICYYAIATEMRLANARNSILTPVEKTVQFQKSKIFHANAIRIALTHVPCVTEYLEHILKSFKNNYHIDLSLDSNINIQIPVDIEKPVNFNQFMSKTQNIQEQKQEIDNFNKELLKWEILADDNFGLREQYTIFSDEEQEKSLEEKQNSNQIKSTNLQINQNKQEVNDFGFRERTQPIIKNRITNKNNRRYQSSQKSSEEKLSSLHTAKKSKQKIRTLSNSTNLKRLTSQNYLTQKNHSKKKKQYVPLKTSEFFLQKSHDIKKEGNHPETIQVLKKFRIQKNRKDNKKTTKVKVVTNHHLKQVTSREKQSKNLTHAELNSNNCNSTERTKDQTKKLSEIDKKEKCRRKIVSEYLNEQEGTNYLSVRQKHRGNKEKKGSQMNFQKDKKKRKGGNMSSHSKSKPKVLEGIKSPAHKKQSMSRNQKISHHKK